MKQALLFIVAVLSLHSAFSQANTKLSNLVAPTAVNQHLIPNLANARDLGSVTIGWRDAFLRGYVYLDGERYVSNYPGGGANNTLIGAKSAYSLTTGKYNSTLGYQTLYKNTSGYANTASGAFALYNNTTGYSNTAVGVRALYLNTASYKNTAIGDSAMLNNSSGFGNTAVGYMASFGNTYGYYNTAMGYNVLYRSVGTYNTALGGFSMYNNYEGDFNTAVGLESLFSNTDGAYNTAIGAYALNNGTTGYWNTAIGYDADVAASYFSNATALGYNAIATASNQVMLGSTSVTSVRAAGGYVIYSDRRFKSDIKADVPGLAFINELKPVTYHYKIHELNDYIKPVERSSEQVGDKKAPKINPAKEQAIKAKEQKLYTGFVAQDVEEAARKFNYDFSGLYKPSNDKDVYGLSYSDFVVPLVKAVQELDSANKAKDNRISSQQQQIDELRQMVLELKNGASSNIVTSNLGYLEQNTPNPVVGTTTIRYQVPETSTSARLELTNAKGQVLKNIAISKKSMGQLALNTSMLASGTYNYTLYVNGKPVDTKRLVIAH